MAPPVGLRPPDGAMQAFLILIAARSHPDRRAAFFSAITRRRIRRGVFKSVPDLQDAINRYIREHNKGARPFVWSKPADAILDKLARLPAPSV